LTDAVHVVQVTMRRPINMAANRSYGDPQACGGATRQRGRCDKLLVGLLLLTVVRSGEALAGEQTPLAGDPLKPDFNIAERRSALAGPMNSAPASFQGAALPSSSFSPRDFRPRGRSILEKEAAPFGTREDTPMLGATTVWQRLSEYRAHNRVRLLTLWEAGGGSVSLQAGRKGDPSLQWTSRLMNRGGATRGLLDHMFSTSLAGAGRGLHLSPRPMTSEALAKPAKLLEAAGNK
jgi:hypothetical protein